MRSASERKRSQTYIPHEEDTTGKRFKSAEKEPQSVEDSHLTAQERDADLGFDSDPPLFVEDTFDTGEVIEENAEEVIDYTNENSIETFQKENTHWVARTKTLASATSRGGKSDESSSLVSSPRSSPRSSPQISPQKLHKAGFSEPIDHPMRQAPYKRPRFKSSGSTSVPHSPAPLPVNGRESPSLTNDEYDDMDEGAAGISSDWASEDSVFVRRLVSEPKMPAMRTMESAVKISDHLLSTTPQEGNSHDMHSEPPTQINDEHFHDESIVPDSQPSANPCDPILESLQHSVPADTVLNTTSDVLINLSAPSVLTAETQESDQLHSKEKFLRWLQHKEQCRSYVLSDFLEKYCGFPVNQRCKFGDTLASYVVCRVSQVDSPLKMQGRHKELANDDSKSLEKFFRRIMYEMRMQQKNSQVELEIIYGPWSELAGTIGRPMVVFILLYTNVYKLVGESQWLQVAGEVPRFQPSRNTSPYKQELSTKYLTKRDIVFREFSHNQKLMLPSLTPAMQKLFPICLKQMIATVEKRARPMRFLFEHIHINKEGWTSRQKVTKFLMLCIKKIFPRAILGSPSNDRALEKTVQRFINMSATARMPLGQAAHGIKLKDMPWTCQIAMNKKDESKSEAMLLFWEWVFDHFLKPMLAQHFYMTEMSGVPVSLYYYELSVWIRKVKAAGTRTFIDQHGGKERLVAGNDGERLRFVPKSTGDVRPIVNLKEFNQRLKFAHVVLQSLPRSITRLESWQSWYLSLQAFKTQHNIASGAKYYVVKLDISGCYDNVKKQKLEEVVRKHLSDGEKGFWLQTYSVFDSRSGIIRDRPSAALASDLFTMAATNKSSLPIQQNRKPEQSALVYFSKVTGNLQIQGTRLPPEKWMLHGFPYSGDEVLDDLARLIHELKIQVRPSKTLPFSTGIPQGSSCSLDLCNLLLDDLVHTKLNEFIEDPRCLLLRYVDDFLFVTTSKEMAQSYQEIMLRGFRDEYGVTCKEEKQQTNLGNKKVRMEYLGYEFDPDTLDIFPRKINMSASTAPVPVYKTVLVQRMHINLESLLGLLRSHQRAGINAPIALEKRVSRAFGRFVADSFEACSAFVNDRDFRIVFQKLVRMKLLPLVHTEHRTSMLKAAQNMFLIRIQRKLHILESIPSDVKKY